MNVAIDENRIWFTQLQETDGQVYSYIDLKPDATAFIAEENSSVICVSNFRMNKLRKKSLATDFHHHKDFIFVKLKAKSKDDALNWLHAIQSRKDIASSSEDLEIFFAEKFIENEQKICFENDLNDLTALTQFEGMISNWYLLENFREYLKSQVILS